MKKILFLSISLIFIGNFLFAQVAGDYLSLVGGLWQNSANWLRHDGTAFVAATDYPGQNSGTGVVTIANGHSMELGVSPANAIGALTFQEGDDSADLIINDGFTLNVTGAVLMNPPVINAGKIKQIVLNGGTAQLNCASLTLLPSDNDVRITRLSFQDGGIVNVTGSITMGIGTPVRTFIQFLGNGGTLNIGGNIIGGDITPGSGTIIFNGTGIQTLGGVAPMALYNLRMNNAASTLQLDGDVTLNGTLTLTNGKINTQANTLTLANADPAIQLIGGTANSYVYSTGAGRLRRNNLAALILYGFPVGISSHFMRVLIRPTTVSDFAVNVFSGATTDGVEGGPAIADKSYIVDAIWNIDRPVGSGDATINLKWVDALEGAGFPGLTNSQIGVSTFSGGGWLPADAINANPPANRITASLSAFSPLGVGLIDNVLPVKFGPLKAYEKQNGIQLDWKVYSEDKVKNYEVERSMDALSFDVLESLPALYNGAGGDYGFFDAKPLPGESFYRIKNNDLDGKSSYSQVIKINRNISMKGLNLYPNPALNRIVSLQGNDIARGNYKISILNVNGQEIYRQSINHNGGSISQKIELPVHIVKGVFLVTVKNEKGNIIFKEQLVNQ